MAKLDTRRVSITLNNLPQGVIKKYNNLSESKGLSPYLADIIYRYERGLLRSVTDTEIAFVDINEYNSLKEKVKDLVDYKNKTQNTVIQEIKNMKESLEDISSREYNVVQVQDSSTSSLENKIRLLEEKLEKVIKTGIVSEEFIEEDDSDEYELDEEAANLIMALNNI